MSDSNDWEKLYEITATDDGSSHEATSYGLFSDSTNMTSYNPNTIGSSTDQSTTLSKSGSKPVRRRSRASKKTPTTLLNANANNFRDLVQQFTGCPSVPFSLGSQRGPVNLNFGLVSSDRYDHHHQVMAGSTTTNYYNHHQLPATEPQQVSNYEQQSSVSFDRNEGNNNINNYYNNINHVGIDNNRFRYDHQSFNQDDGYFS
ncbi:hypothetical protein ACFE04_030019 [Oxalis oulophora]